MGQIDWNKVVEYYIRIKEYYILCEETDPELKTNLQPLNEFRAALDHTMRIIAITNTTIGNNVNIDADAEYTKLISHLKRAYYDICDMLSINYRNKIVDTLEIYDPEIIRAAIPNYYSDIRPMIEKYSEKIATLREQKGIDKDGADKRMQTYQEIVEGLRAQYDKIKDALPVLEELKSKQKKAKQKDFISKFVVPIASIAIGAILSIIGFLV